MINRLILNNIFRFFILSVLLITSSLITQAAPITNSVKDIYFLNAVSGLINVPVNIIKNQSWRFTPQNALKLSNMESFALIKKALNIPFLSQYKFNNIMTSLAKNNADPKVKERLQKLLANASIYDFSSHQFKDMWLLWLTTKTKTPAIDTSKATDTPTAIKADFPKTTTDSWLLEAVKLSAPYYLKAYEDTPYDLESRRIDNKLIKIYRPDHALAHALRKAALMRDLLALLRKNQKPEYSFKAVSKLSKDIKNFDKLIELAILLLRAGRQSEDLDNEHYKDYSYRSAAIFGKEAKKYPELFRAADIADFVQALKDIGDPEIEAELTAKQKWIYNLLYAVHHLDLLRIPTFGGGKKLNIEFLKGSIASFLETQKNDPIIAKLLELSGKYLNATGDRNVPKGILSRGDQFFIQGNNPMLILRALKNAGAYK